MSIDELMAADKADEENGTNKARGINMLDIPVPTTMMSAVGLLQ